jgi:hypothetical protein
MPVIFPANLTVNECEKFVDAVTSDDAADDLVLPVGTDAVVFGGIAAAIQGVLTWARRSDAKNLALRGTANALQDLVEDTLSRPHKFCATMMARSIRDSETSTNLRPILYVSAEAAIVKQGTCAYGQQRGGLCWFVFVDHSTKGFDRNFYLGDDEKKAEVRQLQQIRSVINAMMEKSMQVVGGGERLPDEDVAHIGRLFYELFLNTHEHGSRGEIRENWLKPGLRVLYTNAINLSPNAGGASLRGAPPIDSYLTSLEIKEIDRRRFIEISIVDSGLGYAGRWRADNKESEDIEEISLAEEYKIFKKCFTFRETSSKTTTKGNGLPVVMDRLTKLRGFMKVRSGRLSLYRDFVASPYFEGEQCTFSDWNNGSSDDSNLSEMSPVAGVLVTLLIPLEAKQ